MDSLQVVTRLEPHEKRASRRCRSDHPDEFVAALDDPNKEIAEQCQDGPPRLVHLSGRRSVFSQVRQNLQCCLLEAKQQQYLFVSATLVPQRDTLQMWRERRCLQMFSPQAVNEVTSSFSGSCCALPDIRFVLPPRCWRNDDKLVNESCCDTKNDGGQTSDNIQKQLWDCFYTFCV